MKINHINFNVGFTIQYIPNRKKCDMLFLGGRFHKHKSVIFIDFMWVSLRTTRNAQKKEQLTRKSRNMQRAMSNKQ